jgi:hypothetical protein
VEGPGFNPRKEVRKEGKEGGREGGRKKGREGGRGGEGRKEREGRRGGQGRRKGVCGEDQLTDSLPWCNWGPTPPSLGNFSPSLPTPLISGGVCFK